MAKLRRYAPMQEVPFGQLLREYFMALDLRGRLGRQASDFLLVPFTEWSLLRKGSIVNR